jgi:predicted nucleic acid-binding protein
MATPPSNLLRVMLDANVLVSGVGWPRFQYEILRHAVNRDFQLVLCNYVIEEARRHTRRLFPDKLAALETVLKACEYETVEAPQASQLAEHKALVRDPFDLPVVLAAINSQVDMFVSLDKDLTEPNENLHSKLKIVLPAAFLRLHMNWTSEALEAIRHRIWQDMN